MKQELEQLANDTRQDIADLAKESLEAQIDAINEASAKRRSAVEGLNLAISSGTRDQPLSGAHVRVTHHKNGSITVRVIHKDPIYGKNLFDILDGGVPSRTVGKKFIFQAYRGHTIPTKLTKSAADPEQVRNIIAPGNLHLRYKNKKPVLVVKRPGDTIKKIPGRHFYQNTAEYILDEIIRGHIVNRFRRSKLHIKASDVIIRVNQD